MDELLFLALVYLGAAIPFGVVVTTLYGTGAARPRGVGAADEGPLPDVDVRAAGSGNIGATNVARVFGWRIAVPVLVLDMLKGLIPVVVAGLLWPSAGPWWGGLAGAVAFIGHCWPVYLEFKGGKGVATGAGALLALAPLPTALAGAIWGLVLAVSGRSSLAALIATLSMIGLSWKLAPAIAPVAALFAIGVVIRHVANIGRLIRGEEAAVVKPAVRWGRSGAPATAEDALRQDPGGGASDVPLWREPVEPDEAAPKDPAKPAV